jgi:hypothetical protein
MILMRHKLIARALMVVTITLIALRPLSFWRGGYVRVGRVTTTYFSVDGGRVGFGVCQSWWQHVIEVAADLFDARFVPPR